MRKADQYFNNPLGLILAGLVILALTGAWLYAKEAAGIDYYVTWVAADAIETDNTQSIYQPSSRHKLTAQYRNKAAALEDTSKQKAVAAFFKELKMTATPFLYWVTALLATSDYEKDLQLWQVISLLSVTFSILLLCRLLAYSPATSFALLLPVLVWSMPFYSNIRVANVNGIQLGMIALILWSLNLPEERRYLFITGLLIGLLVMFKPNLAPVALMFAGGWVIRKQYSKLIVSVAGMASAAFMAVLVSSIWMGSVRVWLDWFNYIREFVDGGPGEKGGNYAIITQLFDNIGPLSQLSAAVFLFILSLALLWWGRRRAGSPIEDSPRKKQEFIENVSLISMGCIIPLMTSTLVWLHYYLLTIPMIIVAFRPMQEQGPMKPIPILMLRILPLVALFVLLETALRDALGMDVRSYRSVATTISASSLYVVGLWHFAYGITGSRHGRV